MPNIVLLVEDNPEEQSRAKAVLTGQGFRVVAVGTLQDALRVWTQLEGKLSGIVTDLHIPESSGQYESARDASQPRGLAIVAQAAGQAMPIVICSDINHHYAGYIQTVIKRLDQFYPFSHLPFIMDRKDWERAGQELQGLIVEQGESA